MKKLLIALAVASTITGGTYALTASGASTPQSIYGGGHFNVNFGSDFSPPRDFSLIAQGSSTAATGTYFAGMNQGANGGVTVDIKCFNISSTLNASGGRTAVVGGITSLQETSSSSSSRTTTVPVDRQTGSTTRQARTSSVRTSSRPRQRAGRSARMQTRRSAIRTFSIAL